MSISISFDNIKNFSLSNARVAHLLNNDSKAVTHMGVWDKFKDLFRTEKKQDALVALRDLIGSGEPGKSFAIFNSLCGMAGEGSRALFTVNLEPQASNVNCKIDFCINGQVVHTGEVADGERGLILAKLGAPLDAQAFRSSMTTLDAFELSPSSMSINELTDDSFKSGGVHKKYNVDCGVLQAKDDTGAKDFERERLLAEYADNRDELKGYISTQKKIKAPEKANQKLSYAQVTCYDGGNIRTSDLNGCIDSLNLEQRKSVVVQLVDMVRVLYCNKVSHSDLHMNNLLIHQKAEGGDAAFLKVIDFGHTKFGDNFKSQRFDDINYLFCREARSAIETVNRNHLRSEDSAAMQKHYPLHKLLEVDNSQHVDIKQVLAGIGKSLKADLQAAGEDESIMKQAFDRASASVQQVMSGGLSQVNRKEGIPV